MKRLGVVAVVLAVALVAALGARSALSEDEEPVVVVHWSNSHPMREGLLPDMAEAFNDADHETSSGRPIEVLMISCDSSVQAGDLVSRVSGTGRAEDACESPDGGVSDPTIVTPQSTDWLVDVNHRSGRDVVDLGAIENIAETWLGIVTYRAMAECLGWPDVELGYADILALRADPEGWAAHSECALTEWGRHPLLAFTNPNTSTSGRNVLVSLYSIAAGKPPAELTLDDISRPEVIEYVRNFQGLVDHYLPGTIPLNTKIVQGPRYGQFFLMPEDNLANLYQGNERAIAADGTVQPVEAVTDLVMIYPAEGSVLNSNPAGLVDASWVSAEEEEAAREWIGFLREDAQQEDFMARGFRPATGTGLTVDEREFATWGLDAAQPQATIEPGDLAPEVLDGIIGSWGAVKNPAIVTFVVDTSGSMEGQPLAQVQDGLTRLLDAMGSTEAGGEGSQVGLLTFSSSVQDEIAPAPLREARFDIADAIAEMQARGDTALYDAVRRGIELTEDAVGDSRSTRAVVVLSDGAATSGEACLDDIVAMTSRDEVPVPTFCGMEGEVPQDEDGRELSTADVTGQELQLESDVQVFFLGFGAADVHIGRILAEATGAEYQGSTEEDLAAVIEELSGYF